MTQPTLRPLFAFLCWSVLPALGAESAALRPSAGPDAAPKTQAVPAVRDGSPSAPSPDPIKARFKRPAPLKRLTFSAKEGFSLRMLSNQDVTAEIRNGAGRTLARTAYTLEAGDWTLRPRNLPPGLYTVLLRTGPQLRSMHMKIADSERGKGSPEWVLERIPDSARVIDSPARRGASAFPLLE
ncbi:MAG TPA: hypothetical protein VJ385_20800 [Fibrobacteria bacterium]|nr:hypothetical protein [Fibrobacteria bacterium]